MKPVSSIIRADKVTAHIDRVNTIITTGKTATEAKNIKYYIFNGNTVETIIDAYTNRGAKSALVIDDIGLQIINRLFQEGITDITLILTRRVETKFISTVKYLIKLAFPNINNIKIISEEELTYMNVDLVISNPPYGKIGANITKKIIDTVDFKEYINLLPANDYKRNDYKDLYNYQSDMISIKDGFEDAAVTTHLAKIHKNKVNNMTELEFISTCTFDKKNRLFKFACQSFIKTGNYKVAITDCPVSVLKAADNTRSFIFSERDGSHRHLPYSKDSVHYRWAVAKDIDANWILNKYNVRLRNGEEVTKCHYIEFNTSIELNNFVQFIYSKDGFRFIAMLFDCYATDYLHPTKIFPKVDWTRSWTVEEILADYGYTKDEIKEVMDDLKNYRGMDD